MWAYEKRLQFPVTIHRSDPAFAKVLITQVGGADGELSAALRYMSQRYSMPYPQLKAMLTDIATEESVHTFYLLGKYIKKHPTPQLREMG